MDSDKKPGSRDGKPVKGTRRKVRAVYNKGDTVTIEGGVTQARDPDTGMTIGLGYSLNRDKRWELVEELRMDDDVMVHDTLITNNSRVRLDAMKKKNAVDKAKVEKAKKKSNGAEDSDDEDAESDSKREEKKEEEDSKVQTIKTRKGPKVKTNLPKKEKEDDAWKKEEFEKTVVVERSLSTKESNKVKNIVCKSGALSCRCDYCLPQKMGKGLGNKVQKQLRDQGL